MGDVQKIIEAFREKDPEMKAQTMMTFLIIAKSDEPIPMRQLSKLVGQAHSSTSRNVSLLSTVNRFGRDGHGLVKSWEDPNDRRVKYVELTYRGRRFIKLLEAL